MWDHHCHANSVRPTSSIRADMIFGRDREGEFARKAPPSLGRDVLALGIAYARQERRYGGLARPVAKELDRSTATNGPPLAYDCCSCAILAVLRRRYLDRRPSRRKTTRGRTRIGSCRANGAEERTVTILALDDDEAVLRTTVRILDALGYTAVQTSSPHEPSNQ
jgi:hypothetical protein